MKNRLFQESGRNVYTGCELLVKGGLEGRVNFMTGYPGSPIAEVFDVLEQHGASLREHGVHAQLANNEALASARLNGTQMVDLRAMAFMKCVGVHVASDALAISNMVGTRGGAVVVMGDDPMSDSTQVPADSRFMAQHLFMPLFEPSTFQELKDWVNIALDLSAETGLYVAYLITTHQADGGGAVDLSAHPGLDVSPKARLDIDPTDLGGRTAVVLPPDTGRMENDVHDRRFPLLLKRVRELGLNRIISPAEPVPLGLVTSGAAYMYLEHALHELGLSGRIPILKMGVTHPLDQETVLAFAQGLDHLVVIEERRPYLEDAIKKLFRDVDRDGTVPRTPRVWGKSFPFGLPGIPATLGLGPSILIERLVALCDKVGTIPVDAVRLAHEKAILQALEPPEEGTTRFRALPQLPIRTPGFCPGCPHRDAGAVLNGIVEDFADEQYMRTNHGLGAMKLVFHGDIGCYSMFKYEPFEGLMHNLSGMGLGGGGTGAGIDPFINNKQVVFVGDSTFFHSGMIGISDSIKHSQDITYVVLDNKTTGMTGHQTTPGLDRDLMGNPTSVQDIERAVQGLVGNNDILVIRTDPADHEAYRKLLEQTILQDGVKIIISEKECGITYHRRIRREKRSIVREIGYLPEERYVNITPEVCEYCLECTKTTACPALTVVNTDYGKKIITDRSSCVVDKACAKSKACPSFEEVIVDRKQRALPRDFPIPVDETPPPCDFEDVYAIYVAGVGGMGVGIVSAILVQAGLREGYNVHFCDKKGLAIRNGGVYAHILYFKSKDTVLSPLIPAGKSDLMLAMDALEATRAVDPRGWARIASKDRTRAVVNTAMNPTIRTLLGDDDYTSADMESALRQFTRPDGFFGSDFFMNSDRFLGNKIYGNLLLLGAAYQLGVLPLSGESLTWAIEETVPGGDLDSNLKAFNLGRVVAAQPHRFGAGDPESYKEALREKSRVIFSRYGRSGNRRAMAYQDLVEESVAKMQALEESEHRHFAIRVYDLVMYQNVKYARRYAQLVVQTHLRDTEEHRYAATRAVIRYLHKVMCIKDEIYVAHLLTSEEKRQRDHARYSINPANGDDIRYVHFNRPSFTIFGKDLEFDINTRDWQLNLMKRMKFLRVLLPAWHRREKVFRDWYIGLASSFKYGDAQQYARFVAALVTPEEVRGYREIRYPTMDVARQKAGALLAQQRKPEAASAEDETP